MDIEKRRRLIEELLVDSSEAPIVPIARFFDGNDDPGSIGCNLSEHPGVEEFQRLLAGLEHRADVRAVYAQISEIDPGEDSWPFADTILIVGAIPAAELRRLLSKLQPDEVGALAEAEIPPAVHRFHSGPVLFAWWD